MTTLFFPSSMKFLLVFVVLILLHADQSFLSTVTATSVKPNETSMAVMTTGAPTAANTTTPTTTAKPTTPTTTAKPTTPTTTAKPTTTTVKPTTTTVKPTTTTVKPTTPPTTVKPTTPPTTVKPTTPPTTVKPTTPPTTVKPTTPPKNVSSSAPPTTVPTSAPPTTVPTSAPPTTTHTPVTTTKPAKGPAQNNYMVNGTNETCIIMSAKITYKYNKAIQGAVTNKVTYSGTCRNLTDTLTIQTGHVTLKLVFHNASTESYLKTITLKPNGLPAVSLANTTDFKVHSNNEYYICNSTITLSLGNSTVSFQDMALQTFRHDNSSVYKGSAQVCSNDRKTSSVVPIAVGAALAGLVVIVLIAYLIGRKRSRRGYESV